MTLAYGEVGSGPALVLLHAFPLDHSLYREVSEPIAALGWRVITPDLRGFGASPGVATTMEDLAADVAALLDALSEESVVIGGCSLGGYVALAFAAQYPHRVAGLVCIDTKATADGDEARANRERIAKQVRGSGSTAALAATMPASLLGHTTQATRPDLVEWAKDTILAAAPEAVAATQLAMAARPDRQEMLGGLHVPVLAIRGDEDVVSTAADHETIADAAHDAVSVTVPGSGHLLPIEAPEAFVEQLGAFLRRLRAPYC